MFSSLHTELLKLHYKPVYGFSRKVDFGLGSNPTFGSKMFDFLPFHQFLYVYTYYIITRIERVKDFIRIGYFFRGNDLPYGICEFDTLNTDV